jgi:hypothetical protein
VATSEATLTAGWSTLFSKINRPFLTRVHHKSTLASSFYLSLTGQQQQQQQQQQREEEEEEEATAAAA